MRFIGRIFTKNDQISLCFLPQVNIVTGFTAAGKTLLFHALEYLFCVDTLIEPEKASEQLGSEFIGADVQIDNSTHCLKRWFGRPFRATIDNKPYEKPAHYRNAIEHMFGFSETKVLSGSKCASVFLKDWLSLISISEEDLTSRKSYMQEGGDADIVRRQKVFEYFVTGKTIANDLAAQKADIVRRQASISAMKITIKKTIGQPKKSVRSDFERLNNTIAGIAQEIEQLSNEISKTEDKIRQNRYSIIKMQALLETFMSDIDDCAFADAIDTFVNEGSSGFEFIASEYQKSLRHSIEEIQAVIANVSDNIKGYQTKSLSLRKRQDELSLEKTQLESELKQQKYLSLVLYDQANQDVATIKAIEDTKATDVISQYESEATSIASSFQETIPEVCRAIDSRLLTWGVHEFDHVSFDYDRYVFVFGNVAANLLPKGMKSIFNLAVKIALLQNASKKGIVVPSFILVDSLWPTSDFRNMDRNELKKVMVSDLVDCGIQFILMENENREPKLNVQGCNYLLIDRS